MLQLAATVIGVLVLVTCPAASAIARESTSRPVTLDVDGLARDLYPASEALLIYGSKYENQEDWAELDSVPSEVQALTETLAAQNFNVTVIPEASAESLRRAVRAFIAEHGHSNKRLLIYFAGHGWIDERGRGYLVPIDAPDPKKERAKFLEMAASEAEVRAWAEDIYSRHALFIFDNCFSGTYLGTRGVSGIPQIPPGRLTKRAYDVILPNSVIFLSATNRLQKVPSTGTFTRKLIAGLRGGADRDNNGYLYATELGEWMKSEFFDSDEYRPRWGTVGRDSETFSEEYTGAMFIVPQPPSASAAPLQRPSLLIRASYQGSPEGASAVGVSRQRNDLSAWFVRYYQKASDGDKIIEVLDRAKVSYLARAPQLPQTYNTNALACHPQADVTGVRTIALMLHDAGVQIAAILPYRDLTKEKHRIEVLSVAGEDGPWRRAFLTRSQLEQITTCRLTING